MTLQYLLAIARTCIITCIRWEPESSIISSVTEAIQLCNYTELCILCPYMYIYIHVIVYVHVHVVVYVHVHVVEMMKPVTFIILSPGVIPALSAELP